MAKTTEQKLVYSSPAGQRITRVDIAKDGKSIEIFTVAEIQNKETVIENFDDMFPIIDPRELIGHKLLEHDPQHDQQRWLKNAILEGIKQNLPAFRAPCMDPSEEDGKIVFESGNRPATGHSPSWWRKKWKEYMPKKNSRSGTDLHWAAFMGKLMKYLVEEEQYSVEKAWEAVCDNSRDLGHYWNSKNAKNDFEPTGSRKVGKFYDLANTYKIIQKWGYSSFLLTGGHYGSTGAGRPLTYMNTISFPNDVHSASVGWLVLDV